MVKILKFVPPNKSLFSKLKMEQPVIPQIGIASRVIIDEKNFYCPDCGCMTMFEGGCINDDCISKSD